MSEFQDIPVAPYEWLVGRKAGERSASSAKGPHHVGGPLWPDWPNEKNRYHKAGLPFDQKPTLQDGQLDYWPGSFWWGGAICHHFGHQVVDFSSRLVSYRQLIGPGEKLLFAIRPGSGFDTFQTSPSFFREILDYFDFSEKDVAVLSKPAIVETLKSLPQQEGHGDWPPGEAHLQLLTEHAEAKLGRGNRLTNFSSEAPVFVSRASLGVGGRIAGDELLDSLMQSAGATIFHPENHSLSDQLSLYHSARTLIFSEGSALHGIQLLGQLKARIVVLVRRPNVRMLEKCVRARVGRAEWIEVGTELHHGLNSKGQEHFADGILIPEIPRLKILFQLLGLSPDWGLVERGKLRKQIEIDVEKFLGYVGDKGLHEESQRAAVSSLLQSKHAFLRDIAKKYI